MKEAISIARYLLKVELTKREINLYKNAISEGDYHLSEKENFIIQRIQQSAFLCGIYDSASAILNPNNQIRKRFFLMLCILETRPQFSNKFLDAWTLLQGIQFLVIGTLKNFGYILLGMLFIFTLNIRFYVKL
ncbi:MAG: hypothetical protein AAF573_11565 [Bacteroidota bacterium]